MDIELAKAPGVVVDQVLGVDDRGDVLLGATWDDARVARAVWMKDVPDWSRCTGLRVVVVYEDGDEERPIVLGLLDQPPLPKAPPKPKTLRVESERELVIECGKSKIALRADGRIEIRGGHLISRSTGPNKVKGGSVHIN